MGLVLFFGLLFFFFCALFTKKKKKWRGRSKIGETCLDTKKKNVVFFGFSSERSEFQGLGFVSCFAAAASSSSCSTPREREREREMGKGKVLKRMERLGMDKCVA